MEGSEKEIVHVLASSHYVMTKRNSDEALYEMRRADEAEVGDKVLIGAIEREGTVIEKVCYDVPFDQMVIVWTPSMFIVVDGIVSTCHTDEADPRAVNILNYLCQTRIGGYLYD